MTFFDSFKKTVSKTTKDVVKVSGDAVEFTKLKLKISEINDKIEKAYTEIGKEMYKSSVDEQVDAELVEQKCEFITNLKLECSKLEDELALLTNKKICPNCDFKNNSDSVFCSKCGEKFDVL